VRGALVERDVALAVGRVDLDLARLRVVEQQVRVAVLRDA
jgi:hypothetical protein